MTLLPQQTQCNRLDRCCAFFPGRRCTLGRGQQTHHDITGRPRSTLHQQRCQLNAKRLSPGTFMHIAFDGTRGKTLRNHQSQAPHWQAIEPPMQGKMRRAQDIAGIKTGRELRRQGQAIRPWKPARQQARRQITGGVHNHAGVAIRPGTARPPTSRPPTARKEDCSSGQKTGHPAQTARR